MNKEEKDTSFKPASKLNNRALKTVALSLLLGATPACSNGSNPGTDRLDNHTISMFDKSNTDNGLDYSIWSVCFEREVANEANPVGVISAGGHYGPIQMSRFHAENVVIYGLLNPQYKKIAEQFMNPGYESALSAFQKETDKKGVDAYRIGNIAQRRAKLYIKKDAEFNNIHKKLGLSESVGFLSLYKDYGSSVYTNLMKTPLKDMEKNLPQGVKLQDVDPMIIGMWITAGVAIGNIDGVAGLTKGKTLEEINSVEYIDAMAGRFPSVFKKGSGNYSVRYAKEKLGKGHYDVTMREVSQLCDNPQIYDDYIQKNKQIAQMSHLQRNVPLPQAPIVSNSAKEPQTRSGSLSFSVLQRMQSIKALRH